eukprot:11460457-Ditylum_brightwellii.AAC.1
MAFTTDSLMGLIYALMTNEWPTGIASAVVVMLHDKYAPKDLVSKIKLRRQLNAITMKKDEDPSK